MTTLKSLGWDITDYTSMDEKLDERPELEVLEHTGGHISLLESGQAWIKSDTMYYVEP